MSPILFETEFNRIGLFDFKKLVITLPLSSQMFTLWGGSIDDCFHGLKNSAVKSKNQLNSAQNLFQDWSFCPPVQKPTLKSRM